MCEPLGEKQGLINPLHLPLLSRGVNIALIIVLVIKLFFGGGVLLIFNSVPILPKELIFQYPFSDLKLPCMLYHIWVNFLHLCMIPARKRTSVQTQKYRFKKKSKMYTKCFEP